MAEIHPFYETYRGGCGNGAMVEPLRHRQTKGAATDMFYLMPPRHISTLGPSAAGCWTRFILRRQTRRNWRSDRTQVHLSQAAILPRNWDHLCQPVRVYS